MNTPSRCMPKHQPLKANPIKRLTLLVLIFGPLFLALIYLAYLGTLPLVFGICAMAAIWVDSKRSVQRIKIDLQTLAASRHGESLCEFARSFDCRVIDTWIIRAVYEELQEELHCYAPDFAIRASDSLEKDLHIEPEDLDLSLAPAISTRTGRTLERIGNNPYWGKVKSVSDLVMFFDKQPHSSPTPS